MAKELLQVKYTQHVGEVIKCHNINYNCYSDDVRIYMTLKPGKVWHDISYSIESLVVDIVNWVNSNMLNVNPRKTEFTVFSPELHEKKSDSSYILSRL